MKTLVKVLAAFVVPSLMAGTARADLNTISAPSCFRNDPSVPMTESNGFVTLLEPLVGHDSFGGVSCPIVREHMTEEIGEVSIWVEKWWNGNDPDGPTCRVWASSLGGVAMMATAPQTHVGFQTPLPLQFDLDDPLFFPGDYGHYWVGCDMMDGDALHSIIWDELATLTDFDEKVRPAMCHSSNRDGVSTRFGGTKNTGTSVVTTYCPIVRDAPTELVSRVVVEVQTAADEVVPTCTVWSASVDQLSGATSPPTNVTPASGTHRELTFDVASLTQWDNGTMNVNCRLQPGQTVKNVRWLEP